MEKIMEQKRKRSYVEQIRRDPRMKAMLDGWAAQAAMKAEQKMRNPYADRQSIHDAAVEGIALAMTFVLDNDGEYQAVCDERDALLDKIINTFQTAPINMAKYTTEPRP